MVNFQKFARNKYKKEAVLKVAKYHLNTKE